MPRRGRRPALDEAKQREIIALITVGCSRRAAARYVGCAERTIRNTAARCPDFALRLRKARYNPEVTYLQSIRKAALQERYWRAAAWALERTNPQRYAARGPDVITVEQISHLLRQFAEAIVEAVPVERYRKAILKRLAELTGALTDGKRRGPRTTRPIATPPATVEDP